MAYSATAGLAIPGRRHPLVQAVIGTTLALAVRAPLGLHGPARSAGIRWGAASAATVAAGVALTTALPVVRTAMDQRTLPQPGWKWLAIEIPLGTVWSEETAYRGAMSTVAARAFGPRQGRLLQAVVFGLSHVVDARATGEPVAGTVLVTGLAGWVFDWLAGRSGSLIAPALAHLAVNEAGAIAAQLLQRGHQRHPAAGKDHGCAPAVSDLRT
ncbi:MAG TPA: CPBP family intramembrane glutamic endopeptidase [Mycobacterium sp.]|nr:CPBP family intramembrane glutamic endopeptidase [Mycobacterium sp.]